MCNPGYYKINGVCVQVKDTYTCPANSINNGYNCLCQTGYFPVQNGGCDKCPTGTYWNGARCVVINNGYNCSADCSFDPIRGNCYPSPPTCSSNQYYDGASCRCKQGYYLVNNVCQTCPSATTFDGYRCSQGSNTKYCKDPYSIWNGYNCVCMSGYWQLADGKCVSCSTGTYWDGTCCKATDGKYMPLTVAY